MQITKIDGFSPVLLHKEQNNHIWVNFRKWVINNSLYTAMYYFFNRPENFGQTFDIDCFGTQFRLEHKGQSIKIPEDLPQEFLEMFWNNYPNKAI